MALAKVISTAENNSVDIELLSSFVPLQSLDFDSLNELARHAVINHVKAGSKIINKGDIDNKIIFLYDGEVTVLDSEKNFTLSSKHDDASLPLDPHSPRQVTIFAKTSCKIISIDQNLLDILLTWDPYSGYVVNDIEDFEAHSDDWMTLVLQSRVFQRIPPINIQSMFQSLTSVSVEANEIIFKENDAGDYFYIIQRGECDVLRYNADTEQNDIIAHLCEGRTFGEDALITDTPRNAGIKMTTDGVLLRLSRARFDELMRIPVVESICAEDAEFMVSHGAVWLDVRQTEEYSREYVHGSLNIPLYKIRESMQQLEKDIQYVIVCDTGQRSACAAYLLNASGFEAYVLDAGLANNTSLLS